MQEKNKNKYLVVLPYISFIITILFYVHVYFLRMSITGISDYVTKTFHINSVSLSLVAATFYYAYAIMQIPAGLIIDRYSPRLIITGASMLVTIGAVICWHADASSELFVTRIFMGLGASFGFLSILKIANTYFKKETFPFINGLTFTIGTTASILAGAPLIALLNHVEWKDLVFYLSIFGFIITLCALIFLRASPQQPPKEKVVSTKKTTAKDLKEVLSNLNLWLVALYGGFSFTFITIFAGLWLIPILKSLHPDSPNIAIYGNSVMFIGFGLGALILAKLSQWVKKLKSIMVLTSLFTLILFLLILYVPKMALSIQFILIFILGFSVSSTTLAFSYTAKIVSEKVSGFAFSIVNLSQILISAVLLPFSGYLVMLANLHHHIPKHNIGTVDYQVAMSLLVVAALISLFCAWRLKE